MRLLCAAFMISTAAPILACAGETIPPSATVEARYSKEYKTCMESDQGATTYGMLGCTQTEIGKREPELNARYKAVMAKLSKPKQASLRTAQRQWIKDRDARCDEARDEYEGGTFANVANQLCYLRETVQRTIWLETYR